MAIRGLNKGKRSQIFRAIEAILKASPALGCVKTWVSFEGKAHEFDPPTQGLCPFVRLRLEPRPIVMTAEALAKIEVSVLIEVAVEGTCQDDILDLWESIEDALARSASYDGTTVAHYLRNRSITDPSGAEMPGHGAFETRFEQPAIFPAGIDKDKPPVMLAAEGRFVAFTLKPA